MDTQTQPVQALSVQLRRAAMDLLARREHSRAELVDKLRRRFEVDAELIEPVLDQLRADNLQSDERFTEAYVRYRRSRGVGPLLIRQELRARKVDPELLESHLDISSEQWLETLGEVIDRKRRPGADSLAERQKLYRFCLSRGFTTSQINTCL